MVCDPRRKELQLCRCAVRPAFSRRALSLRGVLELGTVTAEDDIASVAGQLADLTRTVEQMKLQLEEFSRRADTQQERADNQQERTEIQQERIELAARELADVSDRLQAAANALRESI